MSYTYCIGINLLKLLSFNKYLLYTYYYIRQIK